MKDKNLSILGCGWLGFKLAKILINSGYSIKGSTTSIDKINLLSSNEIDPYLVQTKNLASVKNSPFWNSSKLLINIPPALKKQTEDDYLGQINDLVETIRSSPVRQVIFISSTSVYPDLNKEIAGIHEVDENSALYQSERLFTQCTEFNTTVIRFGGLIGPGRHPSRFFASKKNIPNGKAPVNLIHLDDCTGIIQAVLQQEHFGNTWHAAAPSHPSRQQFYTEAARQAGQELPVFLDELKEWKIIDPVQLAHDLNYRFIHPDMMALLNSKGNF